MANQVKLNKTDHKKLKEFHEQTKRQIEFETLGVLACQMNRRTRSDGDIMDGYFRFKFRGDAKNVRDVYVHYMEPIGEDYFKVGYSYRNYYLENSQNFLKKINPQFVKERKRKYIQPQVLKFFTKE